MSGRKAVFMAEEAKKTKKAAPKKVAAKKTTKKADEATVVTGSQSVSKTENPIEAPAAVAEQPVDVAAVAEEAVKATPTPEEPKAAPAPSKTTVTITDDKYSPEFDLKEMLETGAHFGHQAKRWHPKMAPYIYTKKGGVHIIDLIITKKQLETACQFAFDLGRAGKTLVFVGTKRQAKEIVKEEAINAGAMYIINRWLGGFITNWEQVSKSIKEMVHIRKGLETGAFKQYTKKERTLLDKKAQRLERFFGGVAELRKLPDALFVIDVGREDTSVLEASNAGIPMLAVVDTNNDPTPIDHVIPANDDAVRSLQYMIHAVGEAYKAGRQVRK